MCGIAGFVHPTEQSRERLTAIALNMSDTLVHRGPDSDGVWADHTAGTVLAHRRLAILDLSLTGSQPMISRNGRFVMAYNGEIYNFPALRQKLEQRGIDFTGNTDTEVVLESFSVDGVDDTLKSLVGMFAIALWDTQQKSLTLIRDRLGVKPLYWSLSRDIFIFGSELKAMLRHPDCPTKLNDDALTHYFRFGFLANGHSIYRDVYPLAPGSVLTYRRGQAPQIRPFWKLDNVVNSQLNRSVSLSDQDATDRFEHLLDDAVQSHMLADVPLGAFLSGGIDSSLVVATMQKFSRQPVKTFTVGFQQTKYNEAQLAAAIARHLSTDHTEIHVADTDALKTVTKLADSFDEPLGDASQLPMLLLSEATRQQVTVALSGDGGDELFAGYSRYRKAACYRRFLKQPHWIRNAEAAAIRSLLQLPVDGIAHVLPRRVAKFLHSGKLTQLALALQNDSAIALYLSVLSHIDVPDSSNTIGHDHDVLSRDYACSLSSSDGIAAMQYLDTLNYLPNNVLTKLDRTSMAVSLESRVPLLDHRLVEFAWSIPLHQKLRNGDGKWLCRQLLKNYLPASCVDQPKRGFAVPVGQWLNASLREWAEELLSEDSLAATAILNTQAIRKRWQQHTRGQMNWEHHLWDVLVFVSWFRRYRPGL